MLSRLSLLSLCAPLALAQEDCSAATEAQNAFDTAATGVLALITAATWQKLFPSSAAVSTCPAYALYTRETLSEAAAKFPGNFDSGDYQLDARDLSAFLSFVGSATTGWWSTAPCGPEFWGLCKSKSTLCEDETSADCPAVNTDPCSTIECTAVEGKKYYPRGPMMISGNANYAQFGSEVYGDATKFLNNPELLETDAVVGWSSALWMYNRKTYAGQPTSHEFMLGQKATDFKFQSGFGGAMSAMGGYCSKTCGQVEEAGTKAENTYKRITTLMGAKLCGLDTEWTTCGGTKFPQLFEADCPDAVSECASSNVGSYPEGYGPTATTAAPGSTDTSATDSTATGETTTTPAVGGESTTASETTTAAAGGETTTVSGSSSDATTAANATSTAAATEGAVPAMTLAIASAFLTFCLVA